MTNPTFFKNLFFVAAATGIFLAALHFAVPAARDHAGFAVGSVALFTAICVGLFFAGKTAAQSRNRLAFNNLVLISVFGKMAVSLAVLFAYREAAVPTNIWYVGVFIVAYIVFTSFEVWFMMQLAKITN